ncbi:MAG: hypothetical protein E5V49_00535 [Mesorhizobium sp.]|nr:hypothetical protein EN848_31075 [bacterium M00.F.Ca.ET.205.01.1.1]TGU46710.1 hypothetical protein EN795_31470 [bacterium M00.F.Ca.ET.152.01.1.1]TGV31807.1 hypothetical protein EN829_031145 [Mesorhizobium sp. M00.F.Ca.ET.186.01.1.1]TGZ38974.1 hypothetical protein EN805_31065 [bacterium M00.F.Ca.ET.162.01.1.1]TIW63082.1 MAG: hypothetical protein E5V48_00925 [Mesorhizobium sp.]
MPVQKEDYRTNRADYLIAATKGRSAVDDGRNEIPERRRKSLWLRDPQIARLATNPCDSLPATRVRPRGN